MKIIDTQYAMQAEHVSLTQATRTESLRMWVGEQRPDFEGRGRALGNNGFAAPVVAISDAGRSQAASEAEAATEDSLDPQMSMLKTMIEYLTGKTVRIFNLSALHGSTPEVTPPPSGGTTAAPQRAGFGIEYDLHATYEEIEVTTFSASGTVRTSDGMEISFQLDLTMSRHYYEEQNVSLRAGDAVRKDPLVINFDGSAAQLLNQTFMFDLDADGKAEQIARLGGNSAYLALDGNNNGKIDSGRELFGPQRNDGFAELAALDDDGNGWIDEGDAAFSQLKVWQPDANGGGSLRSLAAVGVGALSLGSIATPFELRGSHQEDLGAIRESGLFLYEDGRMGSLQEVDLSV